MHLNPSSATVPMVIGSWVILWVGYEKLSNYIITHLFRFFSRKVEENVEQHLAVQQIVCGASYRAPYLIYGPPGTGKTSTLVEAVKQVNIVSLSCIRAFHHTKFTLDFVDQFNQFNFLNNSFKTNFNVDL